MSQMDAEIEPDDSETEDSEFDDIHFEYSDSVKEN